MKISTLICSVFILFIFSTVTQAQNQYSPQRNLVVVGKDVPMTPIESFLKGMGQYLKNLEDARSKAIENWAKEIRTRNEVKDEINARRPTWIELEEKRLDMAERRHALKLREQKLIEEGVLPPKPEPYFMYNGKKYKSYAEFKGTDEWYKMRAQAWQRTVSRAIEKEYEEYQRDKAIEFLREYRRAELNGYKHAFEDKLSRDRNLRRIMGDEWYNRNMLSPEDSNKKYQEMVTLLRRLNAVREEHKKKLMNSDPDLHKRIFPSEQFENNPFR